MERAEEYFLEVVHSGGLSRAAERLFVSQPSMTKLIQRLEERVGTALFDRSVSPMVLNDAGRLYYRYLLENQERERELHRELGQVAGMERGSLRLGMPSFCAQCYLPDVLERFYRAYPLVEVTLQEASGEELERALLDRRIDLAVLHLPVTHGELEHDVILSQRVLLALPKVEGSDPPELGSLTYILPRTEQKLGKCAHAILTARGIRPRVLLRTQNVITMLELVARGMGAAFVPEEGLASISGTLLEQIRLLPLPDGQMTLAALRRRGAVLPGYVKEFVQCFMEEKQL